MRIINVFVITVAIFSKSVLGDTDTFGLAIINPNSDLQDNTVTGL